MMKKNKKNMNSKCKKKMKSLIAALKKKIKHQKSLFSNKDSNNVKKEKRYYSYNTRLAFNFINFILLILLGTYFLLKTFTLEESKIINYSEYSGLDYQVYLKPNEFYTEEYLPKDMLYVANLIDKIKIDFRYRFAIEEQMDLMLKYKIFGKLVIQDENEENIYYEKTYDLMNEKEVLLKEIPFEDIFETIEIDYEKYNIIANSFNNKYGLNTTSKFIVYFSMDKSVVSSKDSNLLINDRVNNMVINIPLSEKSVDISLDYKDIKNESRVFDSSKVVMNNILYPIVAVLFIISSFIFLVKVIRLLKYTMKKKNIYDSYIGKILREYDRLIVETTTAPILDTIDKNNIIEIEKFTELLDVRDNLKEPIMYYVIAKHQKCMFYINTGDKLYLTTIKKVDLEAEYEKK